MNNKTLDILKLRAFFLLIVMVIIVNIVLLSNFTVIPFFASPPIQKHLPSAYAQTLPDFNIGTVGDWGCNSNTQSTVNNIVGKNIESGTCSG